jgi:hypothetical protein
MMMVFALMEPTSIPKKSVFIPLHHSPLLPQGIFLIDLKPHFKYVSPECSHSHPRSPDEGTCCQCRKKISSPAITTARMSRIAIQIQALRLISSFSLFILIHTSRQAGKPGFAQNRKDLGLKQGKVITWSKPESLFAYASGFLPGQR